jgi:hypothetical protein
VAAPEPASRRRRPGPPSESPKSGRPAPPNASGAVPKSPGPPASRARVLAGVRLPPGLPRRPVAGLRSADVNPRLHSPALPVAVDDDAELLGTLGFTQEELDALVAETAGDGAPESFRSYDESVETSYQCPQCGFEWSGQPKPQRPA